MKMRLVLALIACLCPLLISPVVTGSNERPTHSATAPKFHSLLNPRFLNSKTAAVDVFDEWNACDSALNSSFDSCGAGYSICAILIYAGCNGDQGCIATGLQYCQTQVYEPCIVPALSTYGGCLSNVQLEPELENFCDNARDRRNQCNGYLEYDYEAYMMCIANSGIEQCE